MQNLTFLDEVRELIHKARIRGYFINASDIFALGYMAGKYKLTSFKVKEELIEACRKYDKTDELGLYDTISETLVDLNYLDQHV